jgi:Zn-dependent M28 family amino/carboxypeptidase
VGLGLGVAGIVAAVVILASGRRGESGARAAFDGERAKRVVEELCLAGERYYEAPGRPRSIERLRALLDERVEQTALQRFTATETATGAEIELTNIIGRQNPESPRRVILATHWDTRAWAEEDVDPALRDTPIEGANDGTSGVAVLLEVARTLGALGFDSIGVDYVFFDGEEFGRPGSGDYCQGSRHFAKRLPSLYPRSRPELALVIDMVGDCDQRFLPELSSIKRAPRVVGRLWETAARLGHGEVFSMEGSVSVEDDHTALAAAGIPAALLIDYDYPPWHTHEDRVDKVCTASLERVGDVLVEFLVTAE